MLASEQDRHLLHSEMPLKTSGSSFTEIRQLGRWRPRYLRVDNGTLHVFDESGNDLLGRYFLVYLRSARTVPGGKKAGACRRDIHLVFSTSTCSYSKTHRTLLIRLLDGQAPRRDFRVDAANAEAVSAAAEAEAAACFLEHGLEDASQTITDSIIFLDLLHCSQEHAKKRIQAIPVNRGAVLLRECEMAFSLSPGHRSGSICCTHQNSHGQGSTSTDCEDATGTDTTMGRSGAHAVSSSSTTRWKSGSFSCFPGSRILLRRIFPMTLQMAPSKRTRAENGVSSRQQVDVQPLQPGHKLLVLDPEERGPRGSCATEAAGGGRGLAHDYCRVFSCELGAVGYVNRDLMEKCVAITYDGERADGRQGASEAEEMKRSPVKRSHRVDESFLSQFSDVTPATTAATSFGARAGRQDFSSMLSFASSASLQVGGRAESHLTSSVDVLSPVRPSEKTSLSSCSSSPRPGFSVSPNAAPPADASFAFACHDPEEVSVVVWPDEDGDHLQDDAQQFGAGSASPEEGRHQRTDDPRDSKGAGSDAIIWPSSLSPPSNPATPVSATTSSEKRVGGAVMFSVDWPPSPAPPAPPRQLLQFVKSHHSAIPTSTEASRTSRSAIIVTDDGREESPLDLWPALSRRSSSGTATPPGPVDAYTVAALLQGDSLVFE
mmetsp:Transcript_18976/g.47438  ORF Transcript_18976/g.47438 Transcript_18976/m.47438 type:complete len:660 (-) Transcript_18976:865-2844(-)|eukprot:CAMPEP_0178993756 /NCGR_PEP_ID=MMETSP0795-20121207/6884_1 /TAXON_ID=88552 /ORGANISM="Amoebophrya sp., Strain Ameob2" /LENGTH=659 /DNA_ID=CAMNT_0020685859 /DNA_START=172 /DNA_END=2151 /DNA_ORIENTATION=-